MNKNDNIINEIIEDGKKNTRKFRKKYGSIGDLIIILIILLLGFCLIFLLKDLFLSSVSNFTKSYSVASEKAKDESYQKSYEIAKEKAYEKAKKENAIHNDVYISVDQIREMSKFEVFTVFEYATIVETPEQKKNNIYVWTQFKGKGEFSVDLEQSEILVDHANYYVSIKIPHPTLTYVPLLEETENFLYRDERTEFLFFPKKDNKTGSNIYREQKSKGNSEIIDKLNSKEYFDKANEAAISRLTDLVKLLNSEIADKLVIEIEFND